MERRSLRSTPGAPKPRWRFRRRRDGAGGLFQQQPKQAINGLPGLSTVPVLGCLSAAGLRPEPESRAMVLVTPYIVRAVAPKGICRRRMTDLRRAADPQADVFWAAWILPTAYRAAPSHRKVIAGTYGLSPTEEDESMNVMTTRDPSTVSRAPRRGGERWSVLPTHLSCWRVTQTADQVATGSIPRIIGYASIAVQEADQSSSSLSVMRAGLPPTTRRRHRAGPDLADTMPPVPSPPTYRSTLPMRLRPRTHSAKSRRS